MSVGIVNSFCDYTGNMVRPWAEAGYTCYCYDIRQDNPRSERVGRGMITWIRSDVREMAEGKGHLPHSGSFPGISFAFPPCTDMAVSGARWFKSKGLKAIAEALLIVDACRELCGSLNSPWMLENPVSTLATYWREPDYTFDPYEYAGYENGEGDTYRKKTCIWSGNGFVMPQKKAIVPAPLFGFDVEIDDRIHKMPPTADRGNLRSETPKGFARAVFEANRQANFRQGVSSEEITSGVEGE